MPSRNGKFIEESNCVPFVSGLVGSYSQPVYETVTVRPRVAVAPVPSRMSVAENGAEGGADVFDGELSPPPHAAALSAIAMTSAMRTGTVSSVRSRLVSASQYTLAPMAANTITAGVRPAIASIRIPYEGVELPRKRSPLPAASTTARRTATPVRTSRCRTPRDQPQWPDQTRGVSVGSTLTRT